MSYPERHTVWSATSRIGGTLAAIAIGSTTVAIAESAHAAGLDNPAYAPSQWDTFPADGDGIDFIVGANQIVVGAQTRSAAIIAAASGPLSFEWGTTLSNANGVGAASVTIGGTRTGGMTTGGMVTVLNQSAGVEVGPGPLSFAVSEGELITFAVDSGDAAGSLSIDNFDAPIPTPAMLPGLVGMGIAFWRKKMAGDQTEAAGESGVANGVEV
jgi:hypothetical protein